MIEQVTKKIHLDMDAVEEFFEDDMFVTKWWESDNDNK